MTTGDQRAGDMNVTVGHRVGTNGLYYEVRVPVPREGYIAEAAISVDFDPHRDVLRLELTGELLDLAPEATTAAIQMAFRAIREDRQEHGPFWRVA